MQAMSAYLLESFFAYSRLLLYMLFHVAST